MRAISLLCLCLAADLTPEELIDRLGSPDRVVRAEAARTLEERGDDVLGALRAAKEKADGPAREPIAELVARIEARSLDRPTLVALDLVARPLGEAVATLAKRSGFALALVDSVPADRRVTLHIAESLPFWEALDRLGRAGGVRHDPSPRRDPNGGDPDAATIRLVAGEPPGFVVYAGPLRLHAFAIHRYRNLGFPAPRVPNRAGSVVVEIQAFAEPGRFLVADGTPRVEALDDQGRPLAPPPDAGRANDPSQRAWHVPGEPSLLHWHVPLGLPPDLPAGTPLKLRGVAPVVLASRRHDPLVIALADAAGKAFRSGKDVVRVEEPTTMGPRTTSMVLRFNEADGATPPDRARATAGPEADRIADHLGLRVEFQDTAGQPLAWNLPFNRASPAPDGGLHAQFLVSGATPPARLLIYRLNRLAAEIPFELEGVPSP